MRENNKNIFLNPYILVSNNSKCKKKITLRKYSLFALNSKYPASVICWIIYQFIILKLNAIQISESVKNVFKKSSCLKTIYDILADYLKYIYRTKQIGGAPEKKIM